MAQRGSDKLLQALTGDAKIRALPTEELREVLSITEEDGVKLLQWWIRGQPTPDWLTGAVRVDRKRAAATIDRLLSFDELRFRLDVFPYGIPVPDEVLIRFATPQGPVQR